MRPIAMSGAAVVAGASHYGRMRDAGAATLWEFFAENRSLCHGWSASPLIWLQRRLLGVEDLSDPATGKVNLRIAPGMRFAQHASGVYPTPAGDVELEWKRMDSGCAQVRCHAPKEVRVEIVS
jgi:hypothetical protein